MKNLLVAAVAAFATALVSSSIAFAQSAAGAGPVPTQEGGSAPAGTTSDNAGLVAQSAGLTEVERERARTLFATGFDLWQAGDFAAAEIAFRRGIEIDPVNPAANYYLGDVLSRRRTRDEAGAYLRRAIEFGSNSAEGLRAEAALAALSAPVEFSELSAVERREALMGNWNLLIHRTNTRGTFTVSNGEGDALVVTGRFWMNRIRGITLAERQVTLQSSNGLLFQGEMQSSTHMQGFLPGWGNFGTGSSWEANKE